MVTRNRTGPGSARDLAQEQQLPVVPALPPVQDPRVSVAGWFTVKPPTPAEDEGTVTSEQFTTAVDATAMDIELDPFSTPVNWADAPPPLQQPVVDPVHPVNQFLAAEFSPDIALEQTVEGNVPAEPAQDFASKLSNNSLMGSYSTQYVQDMRALRTAAGLIRNFLFSAPTDTNIPACGDVDRKNAAVHIVLEPYPTVALDAMNAASDVPYSVDLSDLVLLLHKNQSGSTVAATTDRANAPLFLLPIHAFLLKARCPVLYHLCEQRDPHSSYFTAELRLNSDHSLPVPVVDISDRRQSLTSERCSDGIPSHLLHLVPLVVDYLYMGNRSLDLATMRFYCLQKLLNEALQSSRPVGSEIAKFLNPLVGEFLRAEISDYLTNLAGKSGSFDDSEPTEYKISSLFWSVRHPQQVELLMKICIDDTCWRHNHTLSNAVVHTIEEILDLAEVLRLPTLKGVSSALLGQCLCPNNALLIDGVAEDFACTKLASVTLRYLASHQDIMQESIHDVDADASESAALLHSVVSAGAESSLTEKLERLTKSHSATVVTRAEFQTTKLLRSVAAGHRSADASDITSTVPAAALTHRITHTGASSAVASAPANDTERSPILSNDELWLNEESPFLPTLGTQGASVCLSRYISTTANYMLDHSVMFLGGQNLDRMHSMSNRVLTYNYRTNEFKHVFCGGTFAPKTGYMMSTACLQKYRPTHLIALGGRLKKQEVPVTHTNLPQHLQSMDVGQVNTSSSSTMTDICIEASGATSIVHNRLIDVWNLTADREELSVPTAEAQAARAEAMLSDFDKQLAGEEDGPIKGTQAPDLLKKMGYVFELDYRTLTWRSPAVEFITRMQINAYNTHNVALRLQRDNEVTLLKEALAFRVCPAASTLFHEDLQYRCTECLFTANPALPCNCIHSSSATATPSACCWLVQFAGYCNKTELIVGDLHVLACKRKVLPFVPAEQTCEEGEDVEYGYEWIKVTASGVQPPGRFAHSSTVIPCRTQDNAHQSIAQRGLRSAGVVSLHSHSRILYYGGVGYVHDMPALLSLRMNQSSPRQDSNNRGASTSAEFAHYAHWEDVQVSGPAPPTRQGHSLHYLPDADLCVLYGGTTASSTSMNRANCCPEVWLLKLDSVALNAHAENGETVLRVHWESIAPSGMPPSLRARHVSFTVPPQESYTYENSATSLQGVMFVFGGVNEAKLQARQARHEDLKLDFDDEQKDSIIYPLHVRVAPQSSLPTRSQTATRTHAATWHSSLRRCDERGVFTVHKAYSRLLHFATDILVQAPACSLSRDMLSLLESIFTVPTPNTDQLTLVNGESGGESDEDAILQQQQRLQKICKEYFARSGVAARSSADTSPNTALPLTPPLLIDITNGADTSTSEVFGSLLCKRCAWFRTLLTGAMKEAQLQRIELVDTDPVAYRLLLLYLYADAVMITDLQDMVSVLELANKFDLVSLAKRCEGVLVRLITVDNVCELLDYSDTLNLGVLKVACIATILREVTDGSGSTVTTDLEFLDLLFKPIGKQSSTVGAMEVDADAPTADTAHDMHAAAEATVESDGRAELVAAFRALSRDLQEDVWRKYCDDDQVYKSRAALAF